MNEKLRQKAIDAGIDFSIYADSTEAPALAGVTTLRTLQNYGDKLTVKKIQLPGEKFKSNFYLRDELEAIKKSRETPKITPGLMQTSTPENTRNELSQVFANESLVMVRQVLEPIADALESLKAGQERLLLPPAEPQPAEPPAPFLTLKEAADFTRLAKDYLIKLWETGEKITQHKGKRNVRMFSRRELENL